MTSANKLDYREAVGSVHQALSRPGLEGVKKDMQEAARARQSMMDWEKMR